MNEIIDNFKNIFKNHYLDFTGRASRSEMWLFSAVLYLVFMVIYLFFYPFILINIFTASLGGGHEGATFIYILLLSVVFVLMIPFILPLLAVSVRRLHDTGRSGWWLLLNLIPLGVFALAVLLSLKGYRGDNKYGEDPKLKIYRAKMNCNSSELNAQTSVV